MQTQIPVGASQEGIRRVAGAYAATAATVPKLALQIIPPMQADQNLVALEAAMQSLVLDSQHPVALELAGTASRRSFIVRATTPSALDHVEAVLRSQYAQMEVRPLREDEDPLRLEAHEAVSVIELQSGGATYLPLRTWGGWITESYQETIDPIMGLLSALTNSLHTRVIAQLGLVPAVNNWSRKDLRKSIEGALKPEERDQRHQQNIERYQKDMSTPMFISLGVLMGLLMLIQPILPAWMKQVLPTFASGHIPPPLTPTQMLQGLLVVVGLFVAGGVSFFLMYQIRQWFKRTPIYDMRKVAQKTSRMAYRARIRLYAIGPKVLGAEHNSEPGERVNNERRADDARQLQSREGQGRPLVGWEQLRAEREQAEIREETLLRLVAAYRQFNMADGDYLVPKKLKSKAAQQMLRREPQKGKYGWCQGVANSKQLLTVDALAALWHLPQGSMLPDMALIEQKRSRTLLIPPDLARASVGLPPVGYSEHAGYRLPFGLIPQFFAVHTLISGKSGEGKSTIMEHIARDAMKQGGLVLIDPHGDLVDHVLELVPAERAEDVVLIDLSDKSASVGINILDVTLGRGRDKAISDLLKTLSHIWVSSWGPRMENAFEMALRTLFEANRLLVDADPKLGPRQQYTLMDVLPLLTNEHFCHALLQQINDDYLHRWWREYYEPLTLMQQRDIIDPVITKVSKFESIIARRIIGQSVATLNFAQMVAERKIILIKLAKGLIGADVAAIVGATLLGLIQITLEEQGNKALSQRARFPIILDEFQALAGVDYGALAELRKYGATFILATQSLEYLQKLDPSLLPTVLANVKQLLTFHMSAQDSETLHKELGVEPEDILNLDMHTCYVKMPANSIRQPTFSLHVTLPPPGDTLQAESIRTRCRVRYACPVEEIDEALREAMIRSIRLTPAPSARDQGRGRGGKGGHDNRNRGHGNNNYNNNRGGGGGATGYAPPPVPMTASFRAEAEPVSSGGGGAQSDVILLGPATGLIPSQGGAGGTSALGANSASSSLDENGEEKRKRRSRGRRGGRRGKKSGAEGSSPSYEDLPLFDEDEEPEESFVEALSADIEEHKETVSGSGNDDDDDDDDQEDEGDLLEMQRMRERHGGTSSEG